VFDFSKTMLGWGIVGGLIGLGSGVVIAGAWQRVHMAMRRRRSEDLAATAKLTAAVGGAVPAKQASPREENVRQHAAPNLGNLRFDEAGFPAEAFVALAGRVWPQTYDASRTAKALGYTQNIGVWDGERLVGAIRVLTDSYFVATVPEVLVDPSYRKRGIGRELMRRALSRAPGGMLQISATSDSVGFFQRLGCDLAPMGFIMRERASQRSDRLA
jgi:GNAT superfamily N-acetyltransferase